MTSCSATSGTGYAQQQPPFANILYSSKKPHPKQENADLHIRLGSQSRCRQNDAGAYYYHNPAPFRNYEEALLAVKADAEARSIPFQYSQWDDW